MTHNKPPDNHLIQQQFTRSFRWTLAGSITYEVLKTAHCFFLLQLLPPAIYGAMGSLFSLIYLVTYIADMGATNSLPPFINLATQSKQTFKRFLFSFSLFPHLPIIIACATIATYFAAIKLNFLPFLFIIPLIIILETIRSFLRLLLHTIFQAKRIVLAELAIFIAYATAIWIPYLFSGIKPTLNQIFIIHLCDSAIIVTVFATLTHKYYTKLPNNTEASFPENIRQRLIKTRLFNYLLRVTRNMFTSNFLTPLFAIKFGLASAGLFYFASTLASSIQAIVKSVIGYSGNALLANIKNSPQNVKTDAFNTLCQKLMSIVAPIIIFLAINHKTIIKLGTSGNQTSFTLSLSLLFLIISFTEFFFVLYEQFYIIEEAANKLFYFKIFELAAFYGLITSDLTSSPITTLVGLIVIRMISFLVIATNAYATWQIKPRYKTSKKSLITSIVVALSFAYIAQRWLL